MFSDFFFYNNVLDCKEINFPLVILLFSNSYKHSKECYLLKLCILTPRFLPRTLYIWAHITYRPHPSGAAERWLFLLKHWTSLSDWLKNHPQQSVIWVLSITAFLFKDNLFTLFHNSQAHLKKKKKKKIQHTRDRKNTKLWQTFFWSLNISTGCCSLIFQVPEVQRVGSTHLCKIINFLKLWKKIFCLLIVYIPHCKYSRLDPPLQSKSCWNQRYASFLTPPSTPPY